MKASIPILAVLVGGLSFPGFAPQTTPPPLGQRPPSAAPNSDRRVTLDIVVNDHAGHAVPGLQQQDFTILDNKVPQTILSFRATQAGSAPPDRPLQAILVVDAVDTPEEGIAYQRQQLARFLQQGEGDLPVPVSLLLLTDTARTPSVATRDRNTLLSSLGSLQSGLRLIGRAQGFYGATDRFKICMGAFERLVVFERTQPGRKLVIWLGPGWPLLTGPQVQLNAKTQESIFHSVVALSTVLREAGVTLYDVDLIGPSENLAQALYYEGFQKGVPSANKVAAGNLGLQVLAVQSGGRVLNSSSDMASSIESCLQDTQAFYTLTFDSPPADHPDEYHSLQIKIDKPKLTVHTRTGYYAQP